MSIGALVIRSCLHANQIKRNVVKCRSMSSKTVIPYCKSHAPLYNAVFIYFIFTLRVNYNVFTNGCRSNEAQFTGTKVVVVNVDGVNFSHQQACCSYSRWYMGMYNHGGMILTGENRRTRRQTCPNATLSTINPTWTDLSANPVLRGERPVTNHLSHGTTLV
jgi:hypothetical protein